MRFSTVAFFLFNSCLGIFLTYGVFFNTIAAAFSTPQTSTAFVFSVFAIMYSLSSLAMGFLMDAYGTRAAIVLGGGLMAAGLAVSSVAGSYPELIITYSIIAGAGSGSMWQSTSLAVFQRYDASEYRRATGIVSAGTAFGSLIFAPLEAVLIQDYGWRWAFLSVAAAVAAISAAATLASGPAMGVREGRSAGRLTGALSSLRERRFGALYVYYMVGNALSRTMVMLFVVPMLEAGGTDFVLASFALSLIGLGSMLGRMLTNLQRLSEEEIAAISFILQGVAAVGLLYEPNLAIAYLLSFLFGIGYGGYIPEFALIVRKYYGIADYGKLMGVLLTSFGIGAFVGPSLGGVILTFEGSYTLVFWVAGASSILVGVHQLSSYIYGHRAGSGECLDEGAGEPQGGGNHRDGSVLPHQPSEARVGQQPCGQEDDAPQPVLQPA